MFNEAVLVNQNAAKDPAVMMMLENQAAKNWPSSSGFGSHVYVEELIESISDQETVQEYWEEYQV